MVQMSSVDRRNILIKRIFSKRKSFVIGFEKILEQSTKNGESKIKRQLDDDAIDYLLNVIVDILVLLTNIRCFKIPQFKEIFRKSHLKNFNLVKPSEEELDVIEKILKQNSKRKKLHFFGPFDHMQSLIKELYPSIKINFALFLYGISEKMIYHILMHTIFYEEESKNTDIIIRKNTIELVLKLYEISKDTSTKEQYQSNMPEDYDKCIEYLRGFLQHSYDQCHTISRLFMDPIRSFLPPSVRTACQHVATFMTIFRTTIESIEDMNDHLSSGGSGRTGEQGLIGFCLEQPTDDFLLNDFSEFAACITRPGFQRDLQILLEQDSVRKGLLTSSSNILKTFTSKYSSNNTKFNHSTNINSNNSSSLLHTNNPYQWPSVHHRGCERCNSLSLSNENSGFQIHESLGSKNLECNYLINCFRYLLPKIWFIPIFQFYCLYDIILHFKTLSIDENDQQILKDVISMYRQESIRIQDQLRGKVQSQYLLRVFNRINILHIRDEYRLDLTMNSCSNSAGNSGNNSATHSSTIQAILALKPPVLNTQTSNGSCGSNCSVETITRSKHEPSSNPGSNTTSAASTTTTTSYNRTKLKDIEVIGVPIYMAGYNRFLTSGAIQNMSSMNAAHGFGSSISLTSLSGLSSNMGVISNPDLMSYLNSELVIKSDLLQQNESKKLVHRTVYLLTDVLLIYKEDSSSTSWRHHHNSNLRLKKIVPLQSIHVIDNLSFSQVTNGSIIEVSSVSGNSPTNQQDSQTITPTNQISPNVQGNQSNSANSNLFTDYDIFVNIDLKPRNHQYHAFTIIFQDNSKNSSTSISSVYFVTDNLDTKLDWMASLLQIQTNKLFEKYVKEIPRQEIPLRLPEPSKYKFSEPDSDENIRFENHADDEMDYCGLDEDEYGENIDSALNLDKIDYKQYYQLFRTQQSAMEHPQIKYATLHKLIERLTYHTYHDTRALHMFLLAYRRFSNPHELLQLLIDRFNIPPPEFTEEEKRVNLETDQSTANQILNRFRNSYQRRVQRRVIWVLHWWTHNPSFFRYDFASDYQLRQKLLQFLSTIKSKELQNACKILQNTFTISSNYKNRNQRSIGEYEDIDEFVVDDDDDSLGGGDNDDDDDEDEDDEREDQVPVSMIWHGVTNHNNLTLHNIHPVELARQITLYEWDLYHRIQYWEVEGKEIQSKPTPNLTRSKQFSNHLRNWFVYSILSEENLEDRVSAILRVTDIFQWSKEWHNFQCSQEAQAALISAAVYRLKKSFSYIDKQYRHYRDIIAALRTIAEGGKPKKYGEKYEDSIRHIEESNTPVPCVPFIALGVTTKLIHAEITSPNTVQTEGGNTLINFRKHLLLSQIIERYLSFQRLPYRFKKNEEILRFLASIDPLKQTGTKSEDEFEQMMFEISERYEPRESSENSASASSSNLDSLALKKRHLTPIEQKLSDQLNTCHFHDKLDLSRFQSQLNLIKQKPPPPQSTPEHTRITHRYTQSSGSDSRVMTHHQTQNRHSHHNTPLSVSESHEMIHHHYGSESQMMTQHPPPPPIHRHTHSSVSESPVISHEIQQQHQHQYHQHQPFNRHSHQHTESSASVCASPSYNQQSDETITIPPLPPKAAKKQQIVTGSQQRHSSMSAVISMATNDSNVGSGQHFSFSAVDSALAGVSNSPAVIKRHISLSPPSPPPIVPPRPHRGALTQRTVLPAPPSSPLAYARSNSSSSSTVAQLPPPIPARPNKQSSHPHQQ